jgi:Na+-translocating membrane potential-generating system (MpsC)
MSEGPRATLEELPGGFCSSPPPFERHLTAEGDEEERSAMTGPKGAQAHGLPAQITRSIGTLWTRYAGQQPTDVRTELRGDVVTCVLVDAVGAFDKRLTAPSAHGRSRDAEPHVLASYKAEAVKTIVRLTRQRVSSFVSSHDRTTDVATEIFTLEPPPHRRRGPPNERTKR